MKQQIATIGNVEIYGRLWEKAGARRIYLSSSNGIDFGHIDAKTGEYVAGKRDIERWFHVGCVDFAAVAKQF